jgi:hypothetical protein
MENFKVPPKGRFAQIHFFHIFFVQKSRKSFRKEKWRKIKVFNFFLTTLYEFFYS